jgi:hypothetical protein
MSLNPWRYDLISIVNAMILGFASHAGDIKKNGMPRASIQFASNFSVVSALSDNRNVREISKWLDSGLAH